MNAKERQFQKVVQTYYTEHGRSLPWRQTTNPYKILVSEMMLQQTQVDRVIPKYKEFLKTFPSVERLAAAPLSQVLKAWQGLGYNRRAKMLHMCAKDIVKTHKNKLPRTHEALQKLPGIGPYTAGAVVAFAYNQPVSMIETNIRTVYLHHFFKGTSGIHDADILKLVEKTGDYKNPREWYYALMDYGTYLKKTIGNENARSRHYTKQSKFVGSDRQVRGEVLRALAKKPATLKTLKDEVTSPDKLRSQLGALKSEGLIKMYNRKWKLAD